MAAMVESRSHSGHLMRRVSRACLYCRQRKSKCDLNSAGSPGAPPCQRCLREGRECILGGSNRGGRRIRKNKINNITPNLIQLQNPQGPSSNSDGPATTCPSPIEPMPLETTSAALEQADGDDDDSGGGTTSIGSIPRNPSDAWQCLAGIANDRAASEGLGSQAVSRSGDVASFNVFHNDTTEYANCGIKTYRLVQAHFLEPETVWQLVSRYRDNFHSYFPLVPRRYFGRDSLDSFAANEKHLLTAVLTIASKDLVDRPEIHEYCSKYMHELISGIAAGADCDVEAVEALLLLAEWEPQGLRPRIERVGRGEEDRAAWMHVGLALRSGYFLGLDRTSFRGDPSGDAETEARRRLAWSSCYISDRLISVRIGRAFWSRGPGPMTGLVSQDFPSLQPSNEGDEDYAKIFQATLDLTQLYGNVHDVLYSGMRTSNQMMLLGDYVKYVDDFRTAILRWKSSWSSLACSLRIKVTLQMSYEYLRLYTNAFAFQATISQSFVSKQKNGVQSQRDHLRHVFNNVASMQDARFIYESVGAAKAYLNILVDTVDPEKHLRFMPLRFYLYGIYAAVFLYKARSFGVMLHSEEMEVRDLVSRTTEVLKRASAGPDDIGSRYARLLELLWKPRPVMPAAPSTGTRRNSEIQMMLDSLPNQATGTTEPDGVYFSPANDFSWLDLEAVGDYVSGDQMPGTGILELDTFQNAGLYQEGQGQMPTWLDMTSNLLF